MDQPAARKKQVWEHREDFPMLSQTMHGKPLIYFDSAATAQKPQVVIDSIKNFYTHGYATINRAIYEIAAHAAEAYEAVRLKVKHFLNAVKLEEVIFTRGTTESINLVAYSFGKAFIHPGDEILISEIEHHSNIVPWQILCEDRGALLRIAPVNDKGEIALEEFARLLSEKTKLVALSHVSNALGTIHPIKHLTALAHQAGAKILIDGAQGAPHIPVDVQDLDVDFYVFSGHKIYGPTGIGVLYGKEALLEKMPPYQGGGDMIEAVTFPRTTYHALPQKFEAGTPLIAEVIGLGAAVDYVTAIGLPVIQQWEHELLIHATHLCSQIPGFKIIGTAAEKGAIISFLLEGIHPLDIGTMLDLRGIAIRTGNHCAQPAMHRFGASGTARVSFGLYNTKEEIAFFVESLHAIKKLFH